jgi:guanyl-specific ribonuclease Sa
MRTVRFILLLALGLFVLYVKVATHSTSTAPQTIPNAQSVVSEPTDQGASDGVIPPKVLQVLQVIRSTGQPPEGYVGGRVFQNREGHLPAGGDYREFDVDPHLGNRNAERIIVEWNSKKAWYTADHYQTFIPLP